MVLILSCQIFQLCLLSSLRQLGSKAAVTVLRRYSGGTATGKIDLGKRFHRIDPLIQELPESIFSSPRERLEFLGASLDSDIYPMSAVWRH
jgi:hypothetical protein